MRRGCGGNAGARGGSRIVRPRVRMVGDGDASPRRGRRIHGRDGGGGGGGVGRQPVLLRVAQPVRRRVPVDKLPNRIYDKDVAVVVSRRQEEEEAVVVHDHILVAVHLGDAARGSTPPCS